MIREEGDLLSPWEGLLAGLAKRSASRAPVIGRKIGIAIRAARADWRRRSPTR